MAKNVKKTGSNAVSRRYYVKSSKAAKSAAASALTQRSTKDEKFSDGIKAVSRRDRNGLIKLADR